MFFQLFTHLVNLLLHRIKLCSSRNLISHTQKFSDAAVILALAVFKRYTCKQGARLDCWILVFPPIRLFQKKFSKTTLLLHVLTFGVAFSINFLSSSAFLGFRKALEQDDMSFSMCRSEKKSSKRVRDLIFLHTSIIPNIFFRMLISNVHKSAIVINSIETRFKSWNVFEDVH